MTLLQLEYALALKKNGNYSRAAKAVGISQPAMSIQIKKLEEILGLTLFDRTQKKVVATAQGEIFLERAQLLLTQAKQLKELASTLSEEYTGDLEVGVIPTLAPYLLPLFIQQLNEKYPNLTIRVREAITEEIVAGVRAGELDFGIIATPIETRTKLTFQKLFYEPFLLFVSSNHPLYGEVKIDIKKVPLEDIWLLKEGNCLRNQVNDICKIGSRKDTLQNLFYFESNSIESLCRIVELKGGITLLPELTTIQFDVEREHLIKELAGPKQVREISIVNLSNHVRQQLIQDIGNLIRSCIPKRLLEKGNTEPVPTHVEV